MQPDQVERNSTRKQPKPSIIFFWVVVLVALNIGFELYRFVQYVLNWQTFTSLITPFQFWLIANVSFLLSVSGLPVFIGMLYRMAWGPVWSIRYLLATFLIGIGRTLIFSAAPLDPTSWPVLTVQVLMTVLLALLVFARDLDKVFYANQQ